MKEVWNDRRKGGGEDGKGGDIREGRKEERKGVGRKEGRKKGWDNRRKGGNLCDITIVALRIVCTPRAFLGACQRGGEIDRF